MNELSWLLYFGNVAGKAQQFFGIAAGLGGAAAVVATIERLCVTGSPEYSFEMSEESRTICRGVLEPIIRNGFLCLAACGVLAVLMPSRETVYAIAASEMGERALATPTANKALQALNAWLDRQIAPTPNQKAGAE